MTRSPPLFIGLRYLRSRERRGLLSFFAWVSVLGVALGVAALIVVLSVMNGFEDELRGRLLGMTAHGTVRDPAGILEWPDLLADLEAAEGVIAAAPYAELQGMLVRGTVMSGVIVTGVEPQRELRVTGIGEALLTGDIHSLAPGSREIILGRVLAVRLGVGPGESVSLMVPSVTGGVPGARLENLKVTGIFELGLQEHDGFRALVNVEDAMAMSDRAGRVSGIRLLTEDVFRAPAIIDRWASGADLPTSTLVRDWTDDNATYFRAIRIEKTIMTLLLSLVVAVAAFNILATLVMVVTDKRASIAVLRSLGFSRNTIVSIFVFQGVVAGWAGTVAGVVLGVLIANNVDILAPLLEKIFGFEFMPADVYYVTALPSQLHGTDVIWIAGLALLITSVATIYPSLRAASVRPAEVLRYE